MCHIYYIHVTRVRDIDGEAAHFRLLFILIATYATLMAKVRALLLLPAALGAITPAAARTFAGHHATYARDEL